MTRRDPRPWLLLSVALAVLAALGSVAGLLAVDRIYGQETEVFVDQAVAQDLVNLFVVAPGIAVLALLALRGSLAAYLTWLGFLTFTVYNYVIYVFSIQFGPLFLVWVAVFGAAFYALAGGLLSLDWNRAAAAFGAARQRFAAGFLLVTGSLFALLWLSDVVPALLDGTAPKGVTDLNLPTNPVHVLDLAIFLPAVAAVGVSLWRQRPVGYVGAPVMLLFLALTGLPVLVTVFVANARGNEPAWALLAPIGLITALSVGLAIRMLRGLTSRSWRQPPAGALSTHDHLPRREPGAPRPVRHPTAS
jgi:hypothetical protein